MNNKEPLNWLSIYSDRIGISGPGRKHMLPLMSSASFANPMSALTGAIIAGAKSTATMLEENYPDLQIFRQYQRNNLPIIARDTNNLLKELRTKLTLVKQQRANALKPKDAISDVRIAVTLQMLASMKQNEIIQLMMHDRNIAAIVFDNYELLKMPSAVRAELERSVTERNVARNFEATIASAPSLDNLLGERVNSERASELARAELAGLDSIEDEIRNVSSWVSHAIDHAAAMADLSSRDVWAAMQAA